MKSIKNLCHFFWQLEEKYDLLQLELGGVKAWQYKRMAIYYEIAKQAGVIQAPHTQMKGKDHLKSFWGYFRSLFIGNPLFVPKADVLVFPHERTKSFEGKSIDIYTYFLTSELRTESCKVLEIKRPYLVKHTSERNKDTFYLDGILLLSNIFKKLLPLKVTNEQKEKIENVENEVFSALGVRINLVKLLIEQSKKFKINRACFKYILRKAEVKTVYCVVGYSLGDLISACKDLDIEIIEVQHGTFSKYHLGYSYPNKQTYVDYFPTKFLVWNQFWKDMLELPIASESVAVRPFDYMEIQRDSYLNTIRKANSAVVISQGALTEKIASTLLKYWDKFSQYEIQYKLHPGEYQSWQESKSLRTLVDSNRVSLVKDCDLYGLFSESEFQIGVFSTALYEGAEFGCKSSLLDLPGIEYMQRFIELNNLVFTDGIYIDN